MGYVILDKKQCLRNRKKYKRKIAMCLVVVVIGIGVASCCAYWSAMMRRFAETACQTAEAELTITVNNAVADVFSEAKYGDFVEIVRDNVGKVRLLETNQANVNLFTAQTAVIVQRLISNENFNFSLPMGTVSGFVLLSGVGPTLSATLHQIGKASCVLSSKFISVGINQTLHRLYANVCATVEVVVPSGTKTLQTQTEVLIFETVIVGDVPQVYLGKN